MLLVIHDVALVFSYFQLRSVHFTNKEFGKS